MEDDKKRIIDIIKKCLALGDSSRNNSEGEIANALAAAKRLMDQHNLSMAEVAESDQPQREEIIEHKMEERAGAPNWEYDLPRVCNNLFGTRHFISIGYPSYKRKVVFVGYPSDVALAVEVYKLLWMEMMEMGRVWSYENPSPELTNKQRLVRRFKYIEGIVETLSYRSASHYQGFSKKEETALTVYDKKKADEIQGWLKSHYDLGPMRRRDTGLHDDAREAGNTDGKKVSLNFSKAVKKSNGPAPLRLGYNK
jgi:hypothetical protein